MIKVDIKSLVKKLNPYCTNALESAIGLCMQSEHVEITLLHWIDKLMQDLNADFAKMLEANAIDKEAFKNVLRRELSLLPKGLAGKPAFSPELFDLVQDAWLLSSISLGERFVRSGAIFLALLNRARLALPGSTLSMLAKISTTEAHKHFAVIARDSIEMDFTAVDKDAMSISEGESFLARFGEDLTRVAREGKIDPVLGRENEIRQMIDILCRRRKNNPILVGEAGVGKTALVEGLATKIISGQVPDILAKVRLVTLDLGAMEAGASVKGEFENRLKSIIKEVEDAVEPVILFIDEAHLLIGSGGNQGHDAANLLKPALARGKIRVIAATTWSEYKKYIEKDPALTRRFQLIKVGEPTEEQAVTILRGLRSIFEANHKVIIRDDALQACARLSTKYLPDRQQPDKAIDVLDTACARVRVNLKAKPSQMVELEEMLAALNNEEAGVLKDLSQGIEIDKIQLAKIEIAKQDAADKLKKLEQRWQKELKLIDDLLNIRLEIDNEKSGSKKLAKLQGKREQLYKKLADLRGHDPLVFYEVDPDVMAQVVSDWTQIPLGKLLRDEAESLLMMKEQLQKRIKGQGEGVGMIAEQIKLAKAGLKDPKQPLGVFLLVGPSGVGKTETALTVADTLFGGEESLITVNMSEFQEKHNVSRLIGSPPGYVGYGEGGMLTEAVRKRPYSVVLLDEVEKAHPDVLNLFYQVFDKGSLTDGEGREVDFSNTVIFLTSNLATDEITNLSLREEKLPLAEITTQVRPILSKWFKPALLARMTIIPYLALLQDVLLEIVALKLRKLEERMQGQYKVELSWGKTLSTWLANQCEEVEMGARNIDLVIRKKVMPPLSEYVLEHLAARDFAENITVEFDAKTQAVRLDFF